MGAVGFLVRAGGRRRATAGLVLAVLLGLAGTVVLGAWAGARRTESAYPRLLDESGRYDARVDALADQTRFDEDAVRGAPGVERISVLEGYGGILIRPDGVPDLSTSFFFHAPADEIGYREVARPLVIDGRLPNPSAADEALVNRDARDAGHEVGSIVDVCLYDFEEIAALGDIEPTDDELRELSRQVCAVHHLEVVGVARFVDELVLGELNQNQQFLVGTPALARNAGKPRSYAFVGVELAPGTDVEAFAAYVQEHSDPAAGVQVQTTELRTIVVARTAAPYVRALAVFAIVAALASIGVLGPAVLRWAATPDAERVPLRAAGLAARQLRAASAARGAAVGGVAAVLAVAGSVALSPAFPIGPVRDAEPDAGLRVDAPVLVLGAAALVVVGLLLGAAAPVRPSRRRARPAAIAERLASAGVAPPAVVGVRAAMSSGQAGAGPVATAAGVLVAVAAVVAALTYQAGLARLLDTPERYGWTWDAALESFEGDLPEGLDAFLADDGRIAAASIGQRASLAIEGETVPSFAFEDVKGSVRPAVLEGRGPRGAGEVALGGQTLARLHLAVGDHVIVRGPSGASADVAIVGRTLLPIVNLGDDLSVGEGAYADVAMLDAVGGGDPGFVLIDAAGEAGVDDLRAMLEEEGFAEPGTDAVLGPRYTADLEGYDEVRWTPLVLAAVLALLGAGVLAHTLTTATRRRLHDLAVLRCVGFDRRDLAATVRWHAATLIAVSLAVGVPVGLASGRIAWSSFAGGVGVVDDAVTPLVAVLAVVGVSVALTLLIASGPARVAATVPPADVLRSD